NSSVSGTAPKWRVGAHRSGAPSISGSERRGHRAGALTAGLVLVDRARLVERQRDVVETAQQSMLDLRVDVERRDLAVVPDLLRREIDLRAAGAGDRPARVCVE